MDPLEVLKKAEEDRIQMMSVKQLYRHRILI
jgi:hypothetical protein